MKPRIALPADTFTEATNIINQRNAEFAPYQAIQAITKSGGIPIILPTIDPADAPAYIDLFDGLLMLGGFDVDPTFFNEEPHYELGETYRKRDMFEIALLKAAIDAGKAVIAILLVAATKKKIIGDYHHPRWLLYTGWLVVLFMAYAGVRTLLTLQL